MLLAALKSGFYHRQSQFPLLGTVHSLEAKCQGVGDWFVVTSISCGMGAIFAQLWSDSDQ